MKVLQTFALPLGYVTVCKKRRSDKDASFLCGAEDEARTRYLHLGKVALYQMSYGRITTHLSLRPSCVGCPVTG